MMKLIIKLIVTGFMNWGLVDKIEDMSFEVADCRSTGSRYHFVPRNDGKIQRNDIKN